MKKIIRIIQIILLLLALLVIVVPLQFNTHDPKFDSRGMDSLNLYRVSNDLQPITQDEELCTFAETRTREINLDWSHAGFRNRVDDGTAYSDFCPTCKALGENLAQGTTGPDSIIAWRNSPTHNQVMLDPVYNSGCMMTDKEYTVLILGEKEYGVQN